MAVPADEAWARISDAAGLSDWFPGIDSSTVEGDVRTITMGSGIPLAETILTNDSIQRRFQYRIAGGLFKEHLGTIDVIPQGEDRCLVVYSSDADPATMAIVLGGATGNALDELARQLESGSTQKGA
jgi:carbon monoxide dehydrogenase subunit G